MAFGRTLRSLTALAVLLLPQAGALARQTDQAHDPRAQEQTADRPATPSTPAQATRATPGKSASVNSAPVNPAMKPAVKPTSSPPNPSAARHVVTLTKDSLAGELIGELDSASAVVAGRVVAFATLFADLRFATEFSHRELLSPGGQAALLDRLLHAGGLLAVALLLMLAPRPLLRRLVDRMQRAVTRADHRAALRQAREFHDAAGATPAPEIPPEPPPGPEAEPAPVAVADAPPDDPPITDRITAPEATASVAQGEQSRIERDTLDAEGRPQAASPATLPAARLEAAHAPDLSADAAQDEEARSEAASRADAALRRREERARDAMNRHRTLYVLRRIPVATLRLLIELLPVLAFALVFWTGLLVLTLNRATAEVYTAVGMVTIGAWALLALLRAVLSPRQPALRLLPSRDDFARRLYAWLRVLVIVAAVAAAMVQWAQAIDMPWRGVQAIARLLVLVEHLLVAAMIWNLRAPVAGRLQPPQRLRGKPGGRTLATAARLWWVPAMVLDLALWLVWAAQIRDGYARIWQVFIITAVVIVGARLTTIALLGLLDRLLRLDAERAAQHPRIELRVQRYYPLLRRALSWTLTAVAALVLLQGWGIPVLGWLTAGIGRRVSSAIGSITVAAVVALVVYEVVGILLERQIDAYTEGGQSVRAGRLRTLLPIIRSMLLFGLGLVVAFTILSQIGINVAPLLAGASIIGVALGFGSQKLVQDFITGIFLLLENAMQVGDSVTVAGLSGVVEHLTVRTLRLRAGDGSVHIIPFSSVSTVTNVNRGRGNAAVSFDIAPGADIDRAADILKAIALQMRTEDAFRDGMLSDLQYWGVNAVNGSAVTLLGQIVCTDGARWPVQREFNRRVALDFRAKGIDFANAATSIDIVSMPIHSFAPAPHAQEPRP